MTNQNEQKIFFMVYLDWQGMTTATIKADDITHLKVKIILVY